MSIDRSSRCGRIPWLLAVLLGSLGFLAVGGSVQAQDGLRQELAKAAADVSKFLKSQGDDAVVVGQFAPAPQLGASTGPVVSKVLSEELTKLGIRVKTQTKYSVEGRYKSGEKDNAVAARIQLKILDGEDAVLVEYTYHVKGPETVSTLLGLTVYLPPASDPPRKNEYVEAAIKKPTAYVVKTKVRASDQSPYAVEVLVKKKDVPGPAPARGVQQKEGRPFVNIDIGEIYEIRLHNESEYEAAVALAIDGLSMFTFSEIKKADGQPKFSRILVPKKSSVTIKGWHCNNAHSHRFLVTSYPESAAVKVGNTAGVGCITASFSASWTDDSNKPTDEGARSFTDRGTGLGPVVEARFTEAVRTVGASRAVVTIRYAK